MTLAKRLALIGASAIAAAGLAFALPLPSALQHPKTARPQAATPVGICGCTTHNHASHTV